MHLASYTDRNPETQTRATLSTSPRPVVLRRRLLDRRLVTKFLHDGRAASIEEAILAHDGQGRPARDRFTAPEADKKAKLLAYLGSL